MEETIKIVNKNVFMVFRWVIIMCWGPPHYNNSTVIDKADKWYRTEYEAYFAGNIAINKPRNVIDSSLDIIMLEKKIIDDIDF